MSDQAKAVVAKQPQSIKEVLLSDSMQTQIKKAMPKTFPVDRFIRCVMTQFSRNPDLLQCDKNSVLGGVMTAAQLGLEIDPVLGRAYLLAYNDKKRGKVAQLIIGYKGYVDLAYRSGQVASIQAEVVYEKDQFEYALGLEPKLVHIPTESSDRGQLKYAYCVVSLVNGGKVWRVFNRAEIMRHKEFSKAANSEYSPWVTSEPEMWRKTSIRATAALMPLSPEFRDAIAADESDELIPTTYNMVADVATETLPASGAEGLASAAQQ